MDSSSFFSLRITKLLTLVLVILLADQVVKLAVKLNLSPGEEVHLIGDVLKIHFIENEGAAFGLTFTDLSNSEPDTQATGLDKGKLWLTLISLGSVLLIIFILFRVRNVPTKLPWLIAIVLGGALGNMTDRIFYGLWFAERNDYEGGMFYGRVVDLIHLDVWQGKLPAGLPLVGGKQFAMWPVFNLADAAILIGIGAVMWHMFRTFTKN